MQTLDFTPGSTWSRYFTIQESGQLIGDSTWGAEFSLFERIGCNDELISSATVGAGIQWYQPGTLIVTFPQTVSALWAWDKGTWFLSVTNPALTSFDPNGFKMVVASGLARIKPAVPDNSELALAGFPSNPVIPFPYKA